MKKKSIALILAVVMLFGATVGGVLAWLTADADEVVNTFTFGEIKIDLNETDNEDTDTSTKANAYDLIPGDAAVKDPKVTVEAGSEPCYVFVKVTEENNSITVDDVTCSPIIDYTVDTRYWLSVDDANKIYVYTAGNTVATPVDATTEEKVTEAVLAEIKNENGEGTGEHITVNTGLTSSMIAKMLGADGEWGTTDDGVTPVLKFDAAAVQSENITLTEATTIAAALLTATANP